MRKIQITGLIAAAALVGSGLLTACGDDGSTDKTGSPQSAVTTPASDPVTPASGPASEPAPATPADLTLSPGAAGPVKVGMSKAEVAATGLFETGVPTGNDACPVRDLVWKKPFDGVLDVQAKRNGEIASIGVWKSGPTTADGIGVGSTLADVLDAYPGSKAVPAGYGQTGVLVHDTTTDGWIGFLVDADPAKAKDSDTVSFIELTQGEKPSVQRDGC